MTGRSSAPPQALFWTITLLFGVTLALGSAEIGARGWEAWRAGARPAPQPLAILRPNPHGTGSYRLMPGLDVLAHVGAREIRIRTNSHGMRWREVPLQKAEHKRRIAFLGDSFAFGAWADSVEESLVGIFESRVSPRRFEVLNFGVGGYGVADSALLLEEEVLAFSPDYVILALFNGNDFRDTYLGLGKEQISQGTALLDHDLARRSLPPEDLVEDSSLARPSPPATRTAVLLGRSAFYRLLAPVLRLEPPDVEFAPNRNFLMFGYWSRVPPAPAALRAREATLASIGHLASLLAQRDIRFGVVAIPYKEQVFARETTGRGYDVGLPQAWLQVFAAERGIPFLDLLPALREEAHARNARLYLPNDIHFDNEGHRILGELVAEWFRCCLKG